MCQKKKSLRYRIETKICLHKCQYTKWIIKLEHSLFLIPEPEQVTTTVTKKWFLSKVQNKSQPCHCLKILFGMPYLQNTKSIPHGW